MKKLLLFAGVFLALITTLAPNPAQASHNPVICFAPIIVSN
jgi:hypothetical protein